MILVIDHRDSFTHNLVQLIERLGRRTRVVTSDAMPAEALVALAPEAVVLSPGPGSPSGAAVFGEVLSLLPPTTPVLGVCLGHQAIGGWCGGEVVRGTPTHGRTSQVHHQGAGILAGVVSPFSAARYHSLVLRADAVPDDLAVDGWTEDGVVMAVHHRSRPWFGLQFHPESILTPEGPTIVGNFLALAAS